MIDPPPVFFISGMAYLEQSHDPLASISNVRCHSSSSRSKMVLMLPRTPALFTRMSSLP